MIHVFISSNHGIMIKRYYIVFLILMLPLISVFSQVPSVLKGKVIDVETGEALIGVTIIEVNELNRSLNGTVTDLNGNFTLRLSNPDTKVKISYIGFMTEEHTISGQTFLEVDLEEETQLLDEVVVTAEAKKIGGFIPVSERDLTSAVSTVDMKELEEIKVSSVGEMLQGRASNVDITMASGDPGAGMSIRIRGLLALGIVENQKTIFCT